MVKYQKRVETFEAEQFLVDQQPWPDGVYAAEMACSIFPVEAVDGEWCALHGKPHCRQVYRVETDSPYDVPWIESGSWVLTYPNGFRRVLSDEGLHAFYTPEEM